MMLSFTGDIRVNGAYTKRIDFLIFCWFFLKQKDSGVSLGFRGAGYELIILESGRKGGHFKKAGSPLSLLLCLFLQPICGPIHFIGNVSLF